MTRDISGPPDHGLGHDSLEASVVAALWEEMPFPRLPIDAPPELRELVVNIENPRRVYAIHRATRRRYLQLLIEKFVTQLRHGCGNNQCITPSCFSCRRRLAGKDPLRRYNPTSARTLAVYLASQDHPETRLCPHLQRVKGPSDAIKHLSIRPSPKASSKDSPSQTKSSPKTRSEVPGRGMATAATPTGRGDRSAIHASPVITERPVTKDYRSFAANTFGTVAFKMLEWLTPNTLDAISTKVAAASHDSADAFDDASRSNIDSDAAEEPASTGSTLSSSDNASERPDSHSPQLNGQEPGSIRSEENQITGQDETETGTRRISPAQRLPPRHSTNPRADSSTLFRGSSLSTSTAADTGYCEDVPLSPKAWSSQPQSEGVAKTLARNSLVKQPVPKLTAHDTFNVSLGPPVHRTEQPSPQVTRKQSLQDNQGNEIPVEKSALSLKARTKLERHVPELTSELEVFLPQSLHMLDLRTVNLIYDVLQEDATAETHPFHPTSISEELIRNLDVASPLKRIPPSSSCTKRRSEWKSFIEQSLFNVFSDAHAVLDSFVASNGLVDSHMTWCSMLRLTRSAPHLVFDSLWISLARVFASPRELQSRQTPINNGSTVTKTACSNKEASALMAICFHALAAAAPLVTDYRELGDMSRWKSQGLVEGRNEVLLPQPTNLCMQYEDTFTDELALRLARRLLTAIPARRYFDQLAVPDRGKRTSDPTDPNILECLLAHLDLSSASLYGSSTTDYTRHETRLPLLLLDWARAVMFRDWDGKPDFSKDSPLGGGFELMAALYRNRHSFLLNDVQFRSEHFGERLDLIQVPTAWMEFDSSNGRGHLLDYPFIFSPDTLVTYFRSINLTLMSRSYEESSSLQSRINAIIARESLVTEDHQKYILQEYLKVPAAKFLLLRISRVHALEDALNELWRREKRELMRPLKVRLGEGEEGEEGFDSGGVQQEFFRLAMAQALQPDNGVFKIDDRTRMAWFRPGSLEPLWKFEQLGVLVSLAIYNGLTLPVTFPEALYRKLLGEPVTEPCHISDGWPTIADVLTNILNWDEEKQGTTLEDCCFSYVFESDMIDQFVSKQMVPPSAQEACPWPQYPSDDGTLPLSEQNDLDPPPVTMENREAYVGDYIRYLTHVSIEPQFLAFQRGFHACLEPKSLKLLTAPLLKVVVEGEQNIDIDEISRSTKYYGYDQSDRMICEFWDIVKKYDERMKRQFLEFITASDRVPVGGSGKIVITIQKNGSETGSSIRLPTAYTCYSTLLLPEYENKEILAGKLQAAFENSKGFGSQ